MGGGKGKSGRGGGGGGSASALRQAFDKDSMRIMDYHSLKDLETLWQYSDFGGDKTAKAAYKKAFTGTEVPVYRTPKGSIVTTNAQGQREIITSKPLFGRAGSTMPAATLTNSKGDSFIITEYLGNKGNNYTLVYKVGSKFPSRVIRRKNNDKKAAL